MPVEVDKRHVVPVHVAKGLCRPLATCCSSASSHAAAPPASPRECEHAAAHTWGIVSFDKSSAGNSDSDGGHGGSAPFQGARLQELSPHRLGAQAQSSRAAGGGMRLVSCSSARGPEGMAAESMLSTALWMVADKALSKLSNEDVPLSSKIGGARCAMARAQSSVDTFSPSCLTSDDAVRSVANASQRGVRCACFSLSSTPSA